MVVKSNSDANSVVSTSSGGGDATLTSKAYFTQPSYRAKLESSSGEPPKRQTVVVNHALCQKPEFQHVLFGRLNEQQERTFHFMCLCYWALLWLAIVGYVRGYYSALFLYPVVALCCIRHTVNAHDCNHLKRPLPFLYRLPGYGLFCAGFLPLAPTYGDVAHQHLNVHHRQTKGVIDHDDADPHSRLARMSLLRMTITCAIMPGHICLEDILFHQILKNPAGLWPERVAANVVHWAQLRALYQLVEPNVFWKILMAGHVAMVVMWLFFNGLLHHVEFYRFLVWVDPSGLREIHPLVDGLFRVVSSNAWLEIKWHDVHHAMHIANCTYGTQMARGMTYDQITLACANLADQGLYLDKVSQKPVSTLEKVGHQVGSRQAYLKANHDKCPKE